jgi:uncharacterized Zn finger protein (UPF0148 family)
MNKEIENDFLIKTFKEAQQNRVDSDTLKQYQQELMKISSDYKGALKNANSREHLYEILQKLMNLTKQRTGPLAGITQKLFGDNGLGKFQKKVGDLIKVITQISNIASQQETEKNEAEEKRQQQRKETRSDANFASNLNAKNQKMQHGFEMDKASQQALISQTDQLSKQLNQFNQVISTGNITKQQKDQIIGLIDQLTKTLNTKLTPNP